MRVGDEVRLSAEAMEHRTGEMRYWRGTILEIDGRWATVAWPSFTQNGKSISRHWTELIEWLAPL